VVHGRAVHFVEPEPAALIAFSAGKARPAKFRGTWKSGSLPC